MSNLTINDKMPAFNKSAKIVLADALREGARDVLIKSKSRAPFQKGGLRSETEVKSITPLLWRVSYWKEYARYQEFGGDGKRTVRNYSTSGTGKGYLKKSGDEVANKINRVFVKHGRRARA